MEGLGASNFRPRWLQQWGNATLKLAFFFPEVNSFPLVFKLNFRFPLGPGVGEPKFFRGKLPKNVPGF